MEPEAKSLNRTSLTRGHATEQRGATDLPMRRIELRPGSRLFLQRYVGNVGLQATGGRLLLQRKEAPETTSGRQDVVVIVGRASHKHPKDETLEDIEGMKAWQTAARALASKVFEGLTVDAAFKPLKNIQQPIGDLYIIAHTDTAGIEEISPSGNSISEPLPDVLKRLRAAVGQLGDKSPRMVQILACDIGPSPKTMGQIGRALGAKRIRAPTKSTNIAQRSFHREIGEEKEKQYLSPKEIARMSKKQLIEYIEELNYLRFYDAVPGVKHPSDVTLSREEKLAALADIIHRLGRLPLISYGEKTEEGKSGVMPYGKIEVEQREEAEGISGTDILMNKIIEVNLNEEKEHEEEKGTLNRFAASDQMPASIPPIVHDVLNSPGQPLDAATRVFMEPRFGQDFSRVRVHTDVRAAESAQAVNALAYTVGRDVVFGAGQYRPETTNGRRLLAHELVHVMQQAKHTSHSPQLGVSNTILLSETYTNIFEHEADEVAGALMRVEGPLPSIDESNTVLYPLPLVSCSHTPEMIARAAGLNETSSTVTDPRIRCDADSLDRIENMFRLLIAGARIHHPPFYEAADNLENFLSKAKPIRVLPASFIFQVPQVREARRRFMIKVIDTSINLAINNLQLCWKSDSQIKGALQERQGINPFYTNAVLYAIGRFELNMNANITLEQKCDQKGNCKRFIIKAADSFFVEDRYDFHPGITTPFPYIGEIDDRCATRLEESGRAKSFLVQIHWLESQSFILDCTKDGVSFDPDLWEPTAIPPLPVTSASASTDLSGNTSQTGTPSVSSNKQIEMSLHRKHADSRQMFQQIPATHERSTLIKCELPQIIRQQPLMEGGLILQRQSSTLKQSRQSKLLPAAGEKKGNITVPKSVFNLPASNVSFDEAICGMVSPGMLAAEAAPIIACIRHTRFVNYIYRVVPKLRQVTDSYGPGLADLYDSLITKLIENGPNSYPTPSSMKTYTIRDVIIKFSSGQAIQVPEVRFKLAQMTTSSENGYYLPGSREFLFNECSGSSVLGNELDIERTIYHEGVHFISDLVSSLSREARTMKSSSSLIGSAFDEASYRAYQKRFEKTTLPLWKKFLRSGTLDPQQITQKANQDVFFQWIRFAGEVIARIEEARYMAQRSGRDFTRADLLNLKQDWVFTAQYWPSSIFDSNKIQILINLNREAIEVSLLPLVREIQEHYLRLRLDKGPR